MTTLRVPGFSAIVLIAIIVAFAHVAEGSSRLDSAIKSTQSGIQNAQRAFTLIRNSSGKNTRPFDESLKRLRTQVDALNAVNRHSKQDSGASVRSFNQTLNRLNDYLNSLEKARAKSDWSTVEGDLRRLESTAQNLSRATREVPAASETLSRTRPQPSATNQPVAPPIATTSPRQKPAQKPYATAPNKRPMRVIPQTTAPPAAARHVRPPDSIRQSGQAPGTTRGKKPESTGYGRKPRVSRRSQDFLQALESARSMAEVRKAYARGGSRMRNLETWSFRLKKADTAENSNNS